MSEFDSMEDMDAFMKRCGQPTFQQFCAMTPEQRTEYKGPKNNLLTQIFNNVQALKKVRTYHFVFHTAAGKTYRFGNKMYDMLNAIADDGYDFNSMKVVPEVREDHSTGLTMEINVYPKASPGGIIL